MQNAISIYLIEPGCSIKRVTVDNSWKVETLKSITKENSQFWFNKSEIPQSFTFKSLGITDGSIIVCIKQNYISEHKSNFLENFKTPKMIQNALDPSIMREKARLLDLRQDQIDNNPKKFRQFLRLQNTDRD